MDSTRLHMASTTASYLPSHNQNSSFRRMPVQSTSLPHTSWLSEAGEFNPPASFSQTYLGVGVSAPGSNSVISAGSSSRTIPRARSRDYLSTSPVSPPPPSGSHTQSRHTPSPISSPSHTLHPSRSFTVSSPHKTSGMPSDRDASGHLDMKRLMSKPARQTPSGSLSLPSDSERSADVPSRVLLAPRPNDGTVSRPPLSKSASSSREKMSLHVNTSGLHPSSAPRQCHSSSSSPERKPDVSTKPVRNVLRRRPSSRSKPHAPSPGTMHARVATDDLAMSSRSASAKHQTYARDDAAFPSRASRPTTSPSTSAARPSASLRSKVSSPTPRSPPVLASLTPASAVALAYKRQERRREELAETASFNEAYQPPSSSGKAVGPSPHRQETSNESNGMVDGDEGQGGGPYYTVFGSSSGRMVAVGGPHDVDWHLPVNDTRTTVSVNGRSASVSGSRSLSRKVSGSIKRVTGSIKRERDHREPSAVQRDTEGLDGPMGRSSPSQAQARGVRKPVTLDTALEGRNSPKGSRSPTASPATKSSASPHEDRSASRLGKVKGKDRDDELSPGGRWWKLVKRISTGGLRDKYQQDPAPPPVPALPQYLSSLTPSRTTMEIASRNMHGEEVGENGVLLRRFMQSRASMSGVRPNLSPKPPSSGSSRPSTSNGTIGPSSTGNTAKNRMSISGHRPGTTTGSSSPHSSEMASSGFSNSHRAASARSSISSYGEEIPPVPKNVGQYIMSPSELSRMAKTSLDHASPSPSQSKRARMTSRAHTAPPEPLKLSEDSSRNVPSLPLPPRRATTGPYIPSPVSPSFNVEDTINNLMPPHSTGPPPLTEFGMKEPPPRPKRSSRRVLPPNVEIPSRSQSMSATSPHSPATPRALPQVRVNIDLVRRPSTGALSYASTARQISAGSSNSNSNSPASALTSPSSAVSQKRSPPTFREMESPRHRLTEKEKADRWEDLLERSARAGGTLHIGESHLLSDQRDDVSSFHGSDSDA